MKNGAGRAGFTLIEMIAAILISAIVVAIAGMWIVNVTNGLLTSKQNASTALKAEAASLRMEKELHIMTGVTNGGTVNDTELDYTNNRGGADASHKLVWSENTGTIQLDGNPLVNDVTDLALSYGSVYNGTFTSAWKAGDNCVNLKFTLSGSGGSSSTFSMRVRSANL